MPTKEFPWQANDLRDELVSSSSTIDDVNRRSHRVRARFHERFTERWMRMNRERQVFSKRRHLQRQRAFADHRARFGTNDVHAEDLLRVLVRDDFDETIGLHHRHRFAERREGELAHLHFDALRLRFVLGQTCGRNLGIGEDRPRNASPVFGCMMPGNDFRNDFAFFGSLVRKHWRTGQIADRINVRDVRAAVLIRRDEPSFVDMNANVLEADVFRVRTHADGNENHVGRDRFGLAFDLDLHEKRSIGLTVVPNGFGVLVDLAATLGDLAFDDLHAVLINAVEQVRQVLDDGEFRAESLVDHAEFEADDAAADDEQALGHFAQTDGFFRADDLLAVELERRDFDGGRTSREDDVLGFDLFDRAIGLGDIDAVFPDEHRISSEQIRAV